MQSAHSPYLYMTPVEQIKDRLSIVDVVSGYVKLHKAGRYYKAKSPFGNEKTPSFFVSPERGLYHCFSTNKGGDIFTFVQEMEGIDFKGALMMLAERAGVDIRSYNKEAKDEHDRLYLLIEAACAHYEERLKENDDVVLYLEDRGLSKESIAGWRLGYAPADWRELHQYLQKKGFADREIEKAGLIKRPESGGEWYDRFRGRIMFPIFDTAGRPAAFSGRIFPGKNNPHYTKDAAKYINSPETPLYNKSRILYGYDRAKNAIRRNDFAIFVEGQMDLLMSHQAGFRNTVAVSGTALTPEHLKLVSRLSHNILFAFDADRAGIASSGRSAEIALSLGMDVKIASLPRNVDPADIIKENAEQWRSAIRESKHIIEFYLDTIRSYGYDERKFRLEAERTVLPFVARIPSSIDKAHFVSRIADAISLPEASVWDALSRAEKEREKEDRETPKDANMPEEKMLHKRSRKDMIGERLAGILLWQESAEEPAIDMSALRTGLEGLFGAEQFHTVYTRVSDDLSKHIFEVEVLYGASEQLKNEIAELMFEFKKETLGEAYERALSELKSAEQSGEKKDIEALLLKCAELSRTLQEHTTKGAGESF